MPIKNTKLKELGLRMKAKMDEARKAIRRAAEEEAKPALKEFFEEFFSVHQDITAVGWAQYTPYFMDGDPCVFGLGGVYVGWDGSQELADESYGFDGLVSFDELHSEDSKYYKPGEYEEFAVKKELYSDLRELQKALEGMESTLEQAFGDHAFVKVTRDLEIEIEEYDHD